MVDPARANLEERQVTELSRQKLRPPAAKLDEQKVKEIRASEDNDYALARRYGVDARTIQCVRKGKTWSHVA